VAWSSLRCFSRSRPSCRALAVACLLALLERRVHELLALRIVLRAAFLSPIAVRERFTTRSRSRSLNGTIRAPANPGNRALRRLGFPKTVHRALRCQRSLSYLAHVAARAIILIEADDPVIGLMAFVAVGMLEVSSCMIDSKLSPGYHLDKGEELGYFQYGGSTYCLVFRPGAVDEFALEAIPQPHDPQAPLMLVRSKLATAKSQPQQHGERTDD
jgi:hypothetical protein